MKKLKILTILIILVSILFIGKVNATDFPSTITASGIYPNEVNDYRLTLDGNGMVVTNPSNSKTYPTFRIKTYSGDTKFWHCLSGLSVQYPQNGVVCTLKTGYDSSWTEANAAAIAYIIRLLDSTTCPSILPTSPTCHDVGTTTACKVNCSETKYYWKDLLILYAIDKFGYTHGGVTYNYPSVVNNIPVLTTGKTVSTIVNEARSVDTNNPTITKSSDITFKEYPDSDGYFYSNVITITPKHYTSFSKGTVSNSKFTLVSLGNNKYQFKIKATDIELDGTQSFNIKTTATNTYYVAKKYICPNNPSGAAAQAMALDTYETITKTTSLTLSGSVTRKSHSIKVNKVDNYANKVKGAKFELKTQAQKNNNQAGIVKETNASGAITFNKLAPGTYYLAEKDTLAGYQKNTKEYKIVIANDGDITVNGKAQSTNVIKVTNKFTVTEISKKSAVSGAEVPGAKLQILDKDKKEISCKIKNAEDKLETLEKCSWTSTEEPMSIIGLSAGKYYLVETLAPKGYELNPNAVEFEVKDDGTVTGVEMVDQIEVEVPDTLSARSALLLTIAMAFIGLGIGLIAYVRSTRIE